MQRALALDPLSGLILGDVVVETLAGPHPEQALAFARKAVNLYPDAPWAKLSLLDALYAAGQKAAARQMARDLENSPAAIPEFALRSAGLAARDGDTADARKLLAQADDLRDSKYVPADVFAGLAAAAKDWDTLFHWLAVEQAERSTHLPYVRLNPGIPASDPRFLDLLRRMKLPAAPPGPHAGPLRRPKTAASVP